MAGPPVARIMETWGEVMSPWESASEGVSIQAMMFSGAPAATAASRTMRAASIVHLRGQGEARGRAAAILTR